MNRNDGALETREIGIAGMTCDHCARRVENALRGVPGVKTARADRSAAKATVTFDAAATDLAALNAAILKSGYQPTLA
jgi:copper chaperone CopZ